MQLSVERNIQKFMPTGKTIDITSIRPNPAREEIVLEYVARDFSPAGEGTTPALRSIEVFDMLGKLVTSQNATEKVVTLPVKHLAAGSYVLVVRQGSEKATASFVVEK